MKNHKGCCHNTDCDGFDTCSDCWDDWDAQGGRAMNNETIKRSDAIEAIKALHNILGDAGTKAAVMALDGIPAVSTGWISVKERIPEVEERVLVCVHRYSEYTNKDYQLITCAIYEDGKVNVEDSCWCCEDGDYDEENDICYVPKGWYEFHEYGNTEEDGIGLIGWDSYLKETVTHWMPLPDAPKED